MFNKLKKILDDYKLLVTVFLIVGLAMNFYALKLEASDNKERVQKFDSNFEQLVQIAKDLKDPDTWLRQYLVNHNIDSIRAKQWSLIPKGLPLGADNDTLFSVPYLDTNYTPELGIYKMAKPEGIKTLDTLWNFNE